MWGCFPGLIKIISHCHSHDSSITQQGSKIVLVHSYLRVPKAAGQVNILIFLVEFKFSPCMTINFVMQGKCLFSDILRPAQEQIDIDFSYRQPSL